MEGFEVLVTLIASIGRHVKKCFINAIKAENGKAVIKDKCNGCEDLVETYPKSAIKLTIQY